MRFSFLWDLNSEREAEGKNRQEESPDTAASAEHVEGRQDHEGLEGTERPSMSLCVAMLNRA